MLEAFYASNPTVYRFRVELPSASKYLMDGSCRTHLHWASHFGNLPIVEYLLENWALINYRDHEGMTALHLAVAAGHEDLVARLIEKHALLLPNKAGHTPLHTAALNNTLSTRLFVLLKSNINAKDKQGHTAFYYAMLNNQQDRCRDFFNQHAKLAGDFGEWAELLIANQRHPELIQLIYLTALRHKRFDIADTLFLQSPMLLTFPVIQQAYDYAKHKNDTELLQYLATKVTLAEQPVVAVYKQAGNTPLLIAAATGDLPTLSNLLKNQLASYQELNQRGESAFLVAIAHGEVEIAKWLLENAYANLQEQDNYYNSASVIAARNAQATAFKWLIEKNGHALSEFFLSAPSLVQLKKLIKREPSLLCTQQDQFHRSLLHFAVMYDQLDMVDYLINAGIDPNLQDDFGQTALNYANRFQHEEIAQYLQTQGAILIQDKNETPLLDCPSNADLSLAHNLLEEHALGQRSFSTDETRKALYASLASGDLVIVNKLMELYEEALSLAHGDSLTYYDSFIRRVLQHNHIDLLIYALNKYADKYLSLGEQQLNPVRNHLEECAEEYIKIAACAGNLAGMKYILSNLNVKPATLRYYADENLKTMVRLGRLKELVFLLQNGIVKQVELNLSLLVNAASAGQVTMFEWLHHQYVYENQVNIRELYVAAFAAAFKHKQMKMLLHLENMHAIDPFDVTLFAQVPDQNDLCNYLIGYLQRIDRAEDILPLLNRIEFMVDRSYLWIREKKIMYHQSIGDYENAIKEIQQIFWNEQTKNLYLADMILQGHYEVPGSTFANGLATTVVPVKCKSQPLTAEQQKLKIEILRARAIQSTPFVLPYVGTSKKAQDLVKIINAWLSEVTDASLLRQPAITLTSQLQLMTYLKDTSQGLVQMVAENGLSLVQEVSNNRQKMAEMEQELIALRKQVLYLSSHNSSVATNTYGWQQQPEQMSIQTTLEESITYKN